MDAVLQVTSAQIIEFAWALSAMVVFAVVIGATIFDAITSFSHWSAYRIYRRVLMAKWAKDPRNDGTRTLSDCMWRYSEYREWRG